MPITAILTLSSLADCDILWYFPPIANTLATGQRVLSATKENYLGYPHKRTMPGNWKHRQFNQGLSWKAIFENDSHFIRLDNTPLRTTASYLGESLLVPGFQGLQQYRWGRKWLPIRLRSQRFFGVLREIESLPYQQALPAMWVMSP